MAAAARGSTGAVGLLKRGWNEIPEVLASSVMGIIGLGLAGYGLVNYYAKDGDNKRFKDRYIVYRPDDPRAQRIKQ